MKYGEKDIFSKEETELLTELSGSIGELIQTSGKQQELSKIYSDLENKIRKRTSALNATIEKLNSETETRKSVELELIKTNQRMTAVLESIKDGFFSLNDQMIITYANNTALQVAGMDKQSVLGRYIFDVIPEFQNTIFEENYRRSVTERTAVSFEAYFDKEPYANWYGVRIFPFEEGVSVYFQVISDRKSIEHKLVESEERFRNMAKMAPIGIYLTDENGCIKYVNKAWRDIIAVDGENVHGVQWDMFLLSEERAELSAGWKDIINNKGVWEKEYRLSVSDNRIRWVHSVLTAVKDDNGNSTGYIGINMDITSKKLAEENLARERNLLTTLFETIPDSVFVKDSQSRFVWANTSSAKRIGARSVEEIIGKSDFDFLSPQDSQLLFDEEQEMMRSGKSIINTEIHDDKRQEYYCYLSTKVPWKDKNGNIIGLVGVNRDVSELKTVENALRESEERYRAFVESSTEHIFMLSKDGMFISSNGAVSHYKAPLVGKYIEKVFPAELASQYRHNVDYVFESGQPSSFQHTLDNCYFLNTLFPIRINEQIRAIGGISRDITGLKHAEKALLNRLEFEKFVTKLATQFINLDIDKIDNELNLALKMVGEFAKVDRSYIFMFSSDLEFVDSAYEWCDDGINPHRTKLQEYNASYYPWFIERIKSREVLYVPRVSELGEEAKVERSWFISQGIRSILNVPMIADNKVVGLLGLDSIRDEKHWDKDIVSLLQIVAEIFTNAIHRKESREKLYKSETKYTSIFETAASMILSVNSGGIIVDCNKRIESLLGYDRMEVIGQSLNKLVHSDCANNAKQDLEDIIKHGQLLNHEYKMVSKNGRIVDVMVNSAVLEDGNGKFLQTICIFNDITERKKIQLELKESQRTLSTLMSNLPGIAYRCKNDSDWSMVFISEGCSKLTGYQAEELVSNNPSYASIIHEEDKRYVNEIVQEGVKQKRNYELSYRIVAADGREKWVWEQGCGIFSSDGQLLWLEGFISDITEHKKAEKELTEHRSEIARIWRINAMGHMATMLAHELNQPLCAIVNYTESCLRLLKFNNIDIPRLRDIMQEVAAQTLRTGEIIRRIRSLVGKHSPKLAVVDINNIVKEVIELEKINVSQRSVKIEAKLAKDLPHVLADEIEIEQVILNLVRNGVEAMDEEGVSVKELTIETLLTPENSVEVVVRDKGKGISEELKDKVFESFFTTKRDGLGVGLAISKTIIDSHGGRIWAETNLGKGTVFHITLPVKGDKK